MTVSAERRRKDLFAQMAAAPGGARGQILDPATVKQAQARLDAMTPQALIEMEQAIGGIMAEADCEQSIADVLRLAHDVTSLAGSFGLSGCGVVAGEIRTYILQRPQGLAPDWPLLRLLAVMLNRAFRRPDEAPPETLAAQARALVAWGVTRAAGEASA